MDNRALTIVGDDGELKQYLNKINKFDMLTADEEYQLAVRYHEHQDREAAHRLVTAYLRYVVKIAREYGNYGLRTMDLVQEGSIGLMQAVKRFNPYKGFRLATYAMWWIRAAIQEFILRSWSLVKIGTTTAQRKLFFNLRKNKRSIERLDQSQAEVLGEKLGVAASEVLEMDGRMAGRDDSLNRLAVESGDEIQTLLVDDRDDQELQLLDSEAQRLREEAVSTALKSLNERERIIVNDRLLTDSPSTLATLGQKLGISRERVRQLEKQALGKMRKAMEKTPFMEMFVDVSPAVA